MVRAASPRVRRRAFFAFVGVAGPEMAMRVHPDQVVACSGDDC
jgi:hypothetical protein